MILIFQPFRPYSGVPDDCSIDYIATHFGKLIKKLKNKKNKIEEQKMCDI